MPIRITPSSTPMVAGVAPHAFTAASISCAAMRLSGNGRPWAMIVDSSATTGPPDSRARLTSSLISIIVRVSVPYSRRRDALPTD
jgi:hypothetical protein